MIFELPTILACTTPKPWIEYAIENTHILLNDHAICEKKAALAAISLLYSYSYNDDILNNMPKLAKEELQHFEMVIKLMKKKGIKYKSLKPSSYATRLHRNIAKHDPARFVDLLIVAAFIEARSFERFVSLIPHIDDELAAFYKKFAYAEYRHYKLYINIAEKITNINLKERIQFWAEIEKNAILSKDDMFRFHSGIPEV